jgi:hypothetical protein
MKNDIKIDIVTLDTGERFTVYDGNDRKEAKQSEIFASLVVDKSETPAIVVRANKLSAIDGIDGKLMGLITQHINRKVIDGVLDALKEKVDNQIDKADIERIDYIKDDYELPGRIVVRYSGDRGENDIFIDGLKTGILTSKANSYAEVTMTDGREYYVYFYYVGLADETVSCVSSDVKKIWEKMEELGYLNSYISFLTRSDPYEIEKHCGLEVDQEYVDELDQFMDSLTGDDDYEDDDE